MAQGDPFLSVLIPSRNRAKYVLHAVSSALGLPADNVEILVSENYSDDDSFQLLCEIQDPRLEILRPARPCAMHENWEFLLSSAKGEWVTFIGDDDAILPFAVSELQRVSLMYPWCEAVYSARAYYKWPLPGGDHRGGLMFPWSSKEVVEDSLRTMQLLLTGQLNYLYAPQIYSGGFQRRSLLNRVYEASGRYFKSVTPDASSAINALGFCPRYLRLGKPLCVVGSSPSKGFGDDSGKDRASDFFDRIESSGSDLHPIYPRLSDTQRFHFTCAQFCILEAFMASAPICNYHLWEFDHLDKILMKTVLQLKAKGWDDLTTELHRYFGIGEFSNEDLLSYQESYPEYIPDPIPGSVVYSAPVGIQAADITQAVELIQQVYSSHVMQTNSL